MYHYTDDQNSCKKTPMKATIICLPPSLHTCQNVPAAIIKPSVTDSTKYSDTKDYSSDYYDKRSSNSDILTVGVTVTGTSTSTSTSTTTRCGSCCHHWEHKNYDYEKHKKTTSMVSTATPTRQQYNHQKGQEEQNNNKESGKNIHHFHGALRSRNCNKSIVRERCRNFYNLKENITSLRLSKTSASSSSSSPSSSSSSSSLWHCRTMGTESAKSAESTSKTLPTRTLTSTTSIPLSVSSITSPTLTFRPTELHDLQINSNEELKLKLSNTNTNTCKKQANDRGILKANRNRNRNRNRNGNTIWNTNRIARLDDSFTLRTKQLVMPIVTEDRRSRGRLKNLVDMVCELSEIQTQKQKQTQTNTQTQTQRKTQSKLQSQLKSQALNSRPLAKEMETNDLEKELSLLKGDWRRTTVANIAKANTFTNTSTTVTASTNISQTTKTQFTLGELCSRATNAGDIQTDEVENFKWSDVNEGDAVDVDVGVGIASAIADGDSNGCFNGSGDGNRNSSNNAKKISNLKEQEHESIQERHERQEQEDQQHPVSLHPGQPLYIVPSNSLLRRSYNIQRQQLWQQMSVTLVMAMVVAVQQQRHQVVKMFTMPASKLLLSTLMLLMLITTANCWAGRQDVPSNCTFPLRWEGSWFLSGYQQSIHIKGSQISYRGKCAASEGNKYLIVDEKGCHRCLVIYEKHENVLQYKESECEGDSMYMHQSNPSAMAMRSVLKQSGGDHRGGAHPNTNGHSRLSSSDQYIMRSNDDMNDYFCKGRETLQNLCDQIPGDALLYSLFRENAEPVKCPLKGPFIFTYNRGHGECKSPVSNIESCTEDSRLLLSFQACPDVQGTESTVEELTCLAAWKDGNSRYLVGLVSHHHAISNEERYRCFVYEKISSLMGGPSMISSKDAEYKLAQSGDATCNGLDSAEVGSRIMTLRKPPVAERCDFPVWFKGPRHWIALMGNTVYNYHTNDGSVHIIKSNGYMETRAFCEQINKQTSTEIMAVVHYTTGCQSGFMCMMFYRRDTHVIEIQTGKQASRLEDACAPDHFDIHKMPYITLLASIPDPQICPMEGLYNLRGAIGPPYLTTRHKRNHNNKVHSLHGHHHFSDGFSSSGNVRGTGGGGDGGGVGGSAASDSHKRRGTLSFRSSHRIERGSWHANTRGLPVRSRRDAVTTTSMSTNATALGDAKQTNDSTSNVNGKELLLRGGNTKTDDQHNATLTTITTTSSSTSTVTIVSTDLAIVRQRNRRDVPGCITNFKAQRQLWVGCTEPNVIDVRPLCNDEGDEEYDCHGSWTENTTVYIIARNKRTKHVVCISYKPTEGSSARLIIGDACYRGTEKPPEHHLVANLSVFGKCGETGSASSTQIHIFNGWVTLAVAFIATLLTSNLSGMCLSFPAWHSATTTLRNYR